MIQAHIVMANESYNIDIDHLVGSVNEGTQYMLKLLLTEDWIVGTDSVDYETSHILATKAIESITVRNV